jgi:hypothetical protein
MSDIEEPKMSESELESVRELNAVLDEHGVDEEVEIDEIVPSSVESTTETKELKEETGEMSNPHDLERYIFITSVAIGHRMCGAYILITPEEKTALMLKSNNKMKEYMKKNARFLTRPKDVTQDEFIYYITSNALIDMQQMLLQNIQTYIKAEQFTKMPKEMLDDICNPPGLYVITNLQYEILSAEEATVHPPTTEEAIAAEIKEVERNQTSKPVKDTHKKMMSTMVNIQQPTFITPNPIGPILTILTKLSKDQLTIRKSHKSSRK